MKSWSCMLRGRCCAGCCHLAAVHWSSSAVPPLHLHAVGHLQCHPPLPHHPLCHLWPGEHSASTHHIHGPECVHAHQDRSTVSTVQGVCMHVRLGQVHQDRSTALLTLLFWMSLQEQRAKAVLLLATSIGMWEQSWSGHLSCCGGCTLQGVQMEGSVCMFMYLALAGAQGVLGYKAKA